MPGLFPLELGRQAIEFAARRVEKGELVFPRESAPTDLLAEAIKEAAVALKWPAHGVVYDGLHTQRHGFAADVKVEMGADSFEVKGPRLLLQSPATAAHYARTNEERQSASSTLFELIQRERVR